MCYIRVLLFAHIIDLDYTCFHTPRGARALVSHPGAVQPMSSSSSSSNGGAMDVDPANPRPPPPAQQQQKALPIAALMAKAEELAADVRPHDSTSPVCQSGRATYLKTTMQRLFGRAV